MKINRNNYEVFLIDYLDRTLDTALEAELMLFLEAHPDIREEMEGLETVSLESQNIRFTEKNSLKKTEIKTIAGIGEESFEEYFIAFYENDLSKIQQSNLDQFLKANPQLETAFQLHGKLKLQKDESVVYLAKEDLKKKPAIGVWWLSASGVAAAIALLFALFNLLQPDEVVRQQEQIALVHLQSRVLTDINTVNTSPNLPERKTFQMSQLRITEEPFETENFTIAKLDSKTVTIHLNETFDYAGPMQQSKQIRNTIASNQPPPAKDKKKGTLGRVLKQNLKLLAQRFSKQSKNKSADPTFVKILGGSITAFNTITGSEVEMQKEYDNEGHLKAYQIEGEVLNVNRTIPNSRNSE